MNKRLTARLIDSLELMRKLLEDVFMYETFVWYKKAKDLYDSLDYDDSDLEKSRELLAKCYELLKHVPQHDIWAKSVIKDVVKVQSAHVDLPVDWT